MFLYYEFLMGKLINNFLIKYYKIINKEMGFDKDYGKPYNYKNNNYK